MHPLQEKFQITVPNKQETKDDEEWCWGGVDQRQNASQRYFGPMDANRSREDGRIDTEFPIKFNTLPPGMEIDNQKRVQIENMPLAIGGRNDVSGKLEAPDSMDRGFTRLEMKGTDDQYTGEHVDHFYGDAGGYVERNNYLDRE